MKSFGKNDSIMADRGFIISDFFENIGSSVIYQYFLNGCEQSTKTKVKENFIQNKLRKQYNILAIKKVSSYQE